MTAGQTLTITIGANPTLTITFGTNDLAVPPEVSRLSELNTRLATLTGGTASASLVNGNITITAGNSNGLFSVGADGWVRAANDTALLTAVSPVVLSVYAADTGTPPLASTAGV